MKVLGLIFLIVSVICSYPNFGSVDEMFAEDYERIADKITIETAKTLKKEMGLECVGIGGGMMDVIRCMTMSFHLDHEVSITEARRAVVGATEAYLHAINGSKRIRPYLKNYPFTQRDVGVTIFVHKAKGMYVDPGKIACITARGSVVSYELYEPNPNGSMFKDFCEEPYEEALRILNEEKPHNVPALDGEIGE